MGLQEKDVKEKAKHERLISRKGRNRLLGTAFGCLMLDTLLSFIFCLMAPADPRLRNVYASRRQLRTVTIQGVIALFDAIISAGVVVHVVAGILSASLDSFLEAAATKLLQAIFFSLLQTGYPTVLRLTMITLLLLLRVTAAALIFRAAFLTGVLTARPSRDLPKVIVSLLEMGAPVANPQCARPLRACGAERALAVHALYGRRSQFHHRRPRRDGKAMHAFRLTRPAAQILTAVRSLALWTSQAALAAAQRRDVRARAPFDL